MMMIICLTTQIIERQQYTKGHWSRQPTQLYLFPIQPGNVRTVQCHYHWAELKCWKSAFFNSTPVSAGNASQCQKERTLLPHKGWRSFPRSRKPVEQVYVPTKSRIPLGTPEPWKVPSWQQKVDVLGDLGGDGRGCLRHQLKLRLLHKPPQTFPNFIFQVEHFTLSPVWHQSRFEQSVDTGRRRELGWWYFVTQIWGEMVQDGRSRAG